MTPTVKIAKVRLTQWSAKRIMRASVPFHQRSHMPYIKGPHGSTTTHPAIVSGAVGRP